MEFFIFLVIIYTAVLIYDFFNKELKNNVNTSSCINIVEPEKHCYTQNNSYKKKKKKSFNNSYQVKYSETGLANKLLANTGSKRMAKDILVGQYGYSQSEAKSLVGYRGY